jgi:tripartite-type tricarboxylate transporter receptor subunit TctC
MMKSKRMIKVLALVLLVSVSCLVTSYAAVKYPVKSIQLIVPYSTGGGTDALTRVVAAELEKQWGKPVVVVNRPGAASLIGTAEMVRAKKDGYTIGVISNYDYLLTLLTGTNTPYHYDDLEYIASINTTANILVAKKGSPFGSLAELVSYAKNNPGKLTVSVSGKTHIAEIAMFEKAAGIDVTPIMYSSGGDSLNALLGGHTDLGLFDKKFHGQTSDKGCKTLGTFADKRLSVIKDIPTITEQGFDVATETYRVFVAPHGTPKAILQNIADTLKKVTGTSKFEKKLTKMNEIYQYRSGKELQQRLRSNYDNMKKIVSQNPKEFGLK